MAGIVRSPWARRKAPARSRSSFRARASRCGSHECAHRGERMLRQAAASAGRLQVTGQRLQVCAYLHAMRCVPRPGPSGGAALARTRSSPTRASIAGPTAACDNHGQDLRQWWVARAVHARSHGRGLSRERVRRVRAMRTRGARSACAASVDNCPSTGAVATAADA